jgi:hypothetical protein
MPYTHSGRVYTVRHYLMTPGEVRSHGVFALILTVRWVPIWRQEAREVLITWETDQRRG